MLRDRLSNNMIQTSKEGTTKNRYAVRVFD